MACRGLASFSAFSALVATVMMCCNAVEFGCSRSHSSGRCRLRRSSINLSITVCLSLRPDQNWYSSCCRPILGQPGMVSANSWVTSTHPTSLVAKARAVSSLRCINLMTVPASPTRAISSNTLRATSAKNGAKELYRCDQVSEFIIPPCFTKVNDLVLKQRWATSLSSSGIVMTVCPSL